MSVSNAIALWWLNSDKVYVFSNARTCLIIDCSEVENEFQVSRFIPVAKPAPGSWKPGQ